MTLSGKARSALRHAIKVHAEWPAYRNAHNVDLASASVETLKLAAAALGIDVYAIATGLTAPVQPVHVAPSLSSTLLRDKSPAMAESVSLDDDDSDDDDTAPAAATSHAEALAKAVAAIAGASLNPKQVRALVRREIDLALADAPAVRIEVYRADEKIGEVKGHKHPKFAALLRAATAVDGSGYAPNIWLSGPAGSGKTHGVSMVAKALDLPFCHNGAIAMPHELLGFVDAAGGYHSTQFRQAYEHGGCYLFDEVDGSDNAALLALNAALANGTAAFPDKVVERHHDCRIFAAANTWGHGGTADYVGRSRIDAAFLSRFPVKIAWGYDVALEIAISGNADFARRVQAARNRAQASGLKALITPRDSIAGSALVNAGFSSDDAASMTYLASLTPEQARMVEGV